MVLVVQFFAILAILIVGLYFDFTRTFSVIALCVLGALFVISMAVGAASPNTTVNAVEKAADVVKEHLETLARKRLAMVRVDEYGVVHDRDWQREWKHFVDKVIYPRLSDNEQMAFSASQSHNAPWYTEKVMGPILARAAELEAKRDMPEFMTPAGFERWCEKTLRGYGWRAVTTQLSGDQGADVLAEKEGFRVVVQCKWYTSPVGNKSVQEVFAARQHYRYDAAAVVTNAGYTPSARALANSTGVTLLTVHDLDRFDELMGAPWTRVAL